MITSKEQLIPIIGLVLLDSYGNEYTISSVSDNISYFYFTNSEYVFDSNFNSFIADLFIGSRFYKDDEDETLYDVDLFEKLLGI